MITATLLTHDTISSMTGYTAFAEARLGGNGDGEGIPEVAAGTDPFHVSTGRTCWASDTSDGLDSGWVISDFELTPSGSSHGASWDVRGADPEPLVFSNISYSGVFKVDIRAMTQTSGRAQWRSLDVLFLKNGQIVDSYSASAGPSVDKSDASGTIAAEQILEVVTTRTDCDSVIVSGDLRMAYPEGIDPGANDLADQVFVYCSNPATPTHPVGAVLGTWAEDTDQGQHNPYTLTDNGDGTATATDADSNTCLVTTTDGINFNFVDWNVTAVYHPEDDTLHISNGNLWYAHNPVAHPAFILGTWNTEAGGENFCTVTDNGNGTATATDADSNTSLVTTTDGINFNFVDWNVTAVYHPEDDTFHISNGNVWFEHTNVSPQAILGTWAQDTDAGDHNPYTLTDNGDGTATATDADSNTCLVTTTDGIHFNFVDWNVTAVYHPEDDTLHISNSNVWFQHSNDA